MHNSMKNISKYFIKSLTDGATISPDHKSVLAALGKEPNKSEVKDGQWFSVDPFVWTSGMMTNPSGRVREFIFFPVVYTQKVVDAVRNSSMSTLVIPVGLKARVDEGGNLHPADCPPWVPREHIGEHEGTHLSLIAQEDEDEFYTENPFESVSTWDELKGYTESLIDYVLTRQGAAFIPGDQDQEVMINPLESYYVKSDRMAAMFTDAPSNITESLVKILQVVVNGEANSPLKLYGELTNPEGIKDRGLFSSQGVFPANAEAHVAQMTSSFGLSEKQRNALAYQIAMRDGGILPVNGPPGTGKTTLLRSIVANEWTRAAYDGRPAPVIFAASSNNQAVTNIIDCFRDSDESTVSTELQGRWIPEVSSYGTYVCAQSKAPEALRNEYLFHTSDGQGQQLAWHTPEALEKAESYFVDKAKAWKPFGGDPSIQKIKDALQAELRSVIQGVERKVKLLHRYKKQCDEIGPYGGVDKARLRAEALLTEKAALADKASQATALRSKFLTHLAQRGPLVSFFLWVPPVRKADNLKNLAFLSANEGGWVSSQVDTEILAELGERVDAFGKGLKKIESELVLLAHHIGAIDQLQAEVINSFPTELTATERLDPLVAWQKRLDTHDRVSAFKLATHYWEACWLIEAKSSPTLMQDNKKSVWAVQQKLQRLAMLTPCMVSTFFTMAGFLTSYSKENEHWKPVPLFDQIDLLIVDEAGQCLTSVAAACFSLAKKAVVVGDTYQIDPVWNIPESIDRANLKVTGLFKGDEDYRLNWTKSGLLSSQGSLMERAQNRTSLHQCPDLCPGLYLTEHRRCFDSIIRYCNEVIYHGVLEPMRGDPSIESATNTMEFVHVPGESERLGNSRVNRTQAAYIARWIDSNREDLLALIGKSVPIENEVEAICSMVAVVTPFKSQAELIKRELSKYAYGAMTVGTTHALQGAERTVVLFSSVYGLSDKTTKKFYENGANLLNVAVSRAKERFVVFGHQEVFGSSPTDRYSYALRKYLADVNSTKLAA